MYGPGYGVFYFLAMVLSVAFVRSPMVHGTMLVFLFFDSYEGNHAVAARKEMDICPALYGVLFRSDIPPYHWVRSK